MHFENIKKVLRSIQKKLAELSKEIFRSIAFYPILISFFFCVIAVVTLHIEHIEIISELKEKASFLVVRDIDTAKTILSTLVGGVLSLTVFSFSMVMVVLNQASSNFSPRLLPGLISDKKHQIILGFYTGTILYTILILMSLGSYGPSEGYSGFSTILAAIFGIICISLFVYFIHNISSAIQIDTIINKIFKQSNESLKHKIKNQERCDLNTADWKVIYSEQSGYYQGIYISFISDYFKQQENFIEVIPYQSQYIWKGSPLLKIKEDIPADELNSLLKSISFSQDKHKNSGYLSGMLKLTEVAVRAMSPGINDPGTTTDVITKLGQLLSKASQIYPRTSKKYSDNKIILIENMITSAELMRVLIQPIRYYGKNDAVVMFELVSALHYVSKNSRIISSNKNDILAELQSLGKSVKNNIKNEKDTHPILEIVNKQ
ncbi:DUF2254 domain-containing protein [Aquimarina sp. U1-2]|uniref:DUF2254 domain-containing protein n=1 Tax=Aquimarina sp. U1-2 TaxID=2823141 RepID=UPI001AECDE7A|nr:DUF2254 domain-containing protein [Aquimarina sp. U1-2]MBP2830717.1 DUF2254 domain-containing protein [Aquimarina sp. U1-2]